LIILTDDVYGTFADQFVSLFAQCPRNTILVYSFSKYFGATGWRLGIIGIHPNNVLDDHIKELDTEQRDDLHKRYKSIVSDSSSLKFIDRLVADSRSIALNHTAGLFTPQQVQMVRFSLFVLMKTSDSYKTVLKQLIRDRKRALHRATRIGFSDSEEDVNALDYYTILDLGLLVKRIHGQQFANWFISRTNTIEFLKRLARDAHVVLLPGDGFGIRYPSVRVSFANLNEADYTRIGEAIRNLTEEYVEQFNAQTFD
jgi:aspartate 4-decarboxylase